MAVEANIEAKSNLKIILVLEIIHKNLHCDSYLNSFFFKATFLLVTFYLDEKLLATTWHNQQILKQTQTLIWKISERNNPFGNGIMGLC